MKIQILFNHMLEKWYWQIVSTNGHLMAQSDAYSSKRKARAAAWKVWEAMTSGNCVVEEEQ